MKKIYMIISLLILSSCATPSVGFDVEQVKTNELLGAGHEYLDGKIFRIFCGGNGYASYEFVKNNCMYNTANFVSTHGYNYFTMLSKNGDTNQIQSGYVSGGVYIPTTITKHSQYYTILFINEDMINKFDNYYKVSDYLIPEVK